MVRVITLNLNGVRAAARKGCFHWLAKQKADFICVQELKAQESDLQNPELHLEGYQGYFHFAEKKGYSGVGIYTRHQPQQVITGLGWPVADQEGRYVAVQVGGLWVASLYLPSGTSSEERQQVKFEFLDHYAQRLVQHPANANSEHREAILCGDWNIAHKKCDLKNWRSNQKNSGFLPEERAWMDKLFGEMGFVDAFREVNQEEDQYTWWSYRSQAWAKNVGWRIDYQVVTPGLKPTIKSAEIYKDERFSDHAPVVMDYDIILG